MQINNVDSRTFPALWNDLTKPQQELLGYQLIRKGCTTTRQTVWNWATGKSRPATAISRNSVVKVIENSLGIRTYAETLFPAR